MLKEAKQEAGLAEYELRHWHSWKITYSFVPPQWLGKKPDWRPIGNGYHLIARTSHAMFSPSCPNNPTAQYDDAEQNYFRTVQDIDIEYDLSGGIYRKLSETVTHADKESYGYDVWKELCDAWVETNHWGQLNNDK